MGSKIGGGVFGSVYEARVRQKDLNFHHTDLVPNSDQSALMKVAVKMLKGLVKG